MKRLFVLLTATVLLVLPACKTAEVRDYYQIKIFTLETEEQEFMMDNYLETALVPALHRADIKNVGVFKSTEGKNDGNRFIMVFTPFKSFEEIEKLDGILSRDEVYLTDGKKYIEASHDNPPYERIESFLLRSFSAMPQFAIPELEGQSSQKVYELRSYEAATELLYERKVEMFNDAGEVELFKELEFNPVFFGEVLSSAHMPHLMYMITFSDTTSQQQHWDAFRTHPDWMEMKVIDRYLNTVSHITKYTMSPTDYSDI